MAYDIYPAVDEGYNFPPQVRQSTAASTEIKAAIQNESADIVPPLVADALASDSTIRDSVISAAESTISDINIVRAFPEGPATLAPKQETPMSWVNKNLIDPYTDQYTEEYVGEWVGSTTVHGVVPLLSDGFIDDSQIPSTVVRKTEFKALLPPPPVIPGRDDYIEKLRDEITSKPSSNLPIFAARHALASLHSEFVSVVLAGDSITAANPGWVSKFTKTIQSSYPVEKPSAPQYHSGNFFNKNENPGLHVYNGAQSGSKTSDYLTLAEVQSISTLSPSLMIHIIGNNDYRDQVDPAIFKQNIADRIDWCNQEFVKPCQHLLILIYSRMDVVPTSVQFKQYGAAMSELADERMNTSYASVYEMYEANGVPGDDPLDLILPDKVHQTSDGQAYMADLISNIVIH